MTRKLNPKLVKDPAPQAGRPGEYWVFLRDPIPMGDAYEVGIGDVEIVDANEDTATAGDLQKNGNEIAKLMGGEPKAVPQRVFRTRGVFGAAPDVDVVLVIRSGLPIFTDEDEKK